MADGSNEDKNFEFYSKRSPNRIYISKMFAEQDYSLYSEPRRMRILSKVIDPNEVHEFVKIKGELVLRKTKTEREEVKAVFYEDTRDILRLTIQRFSVQSGNPHKKTSFTFTKDEVIRLYKLFKVIKLLYLDTEEKTRFEDDILDDLLIDNNEKKNFVLHNWDLVQEIIQNKITSGDLIALGYRKNQLEIFERLLCDHSFFIQKSEEWDKRGCEAVWQKFFEDNPWIFGYGLSYIFGSPFDKKKLEQITTGHMFNQSGKRVDALMKTQGLVNSLCFVEIKTHNTPLLNNTPYRSECWRISDDLAGSVAQIQKSVNLALKHIQSKTEVVDKFGELTGETVFLYQPKSFVVIGCLDQFINNGHVNEQRYSSFEIFRRSITNPEIITFDELFARAKFIVKSYEKKDMNDYSIREQIEEESEIPF